MSALHLFMVLRSVTLVLFLVFAGSLAGFLMRFRALAPSSWEEIRNRAQARFPSPFAKMVRIQRLMNIVNCPSLYEAVGDKLLNGLALTYRLSYYPLLASLIAIMVLKWVYLRDYPV